MIWLLLIVAVFAVGIAGMYLMYFVHLALDQVCVRHARRFCGRHGLEIRRVRWQPAFRTSGGKRVKTEITLVQLDCFDCQKQRKLVLLAVWPLGLREVVSNEPYPASYDEQWPQKCP